MVKQLLRQPVGTFLALLSPQFILGSAFAAFSLHLFLFAKNYSVNILYLDQWDFLSPLFDEAGWWQLFTQQNGPVREGLGLILTKLIYEATDWNTKAEVSAIVVVLVISTLLALWLKKALFGIYSITDIAIPLIVLSTSQVEILISTAQPAHGALPVLLLFLACLAWLVRDEIVRYTSLSVINFFLIFTGFGIFAGGLTIIFLLLDAVQRLRQRAPFIFPLIALLPAFGSLCLFFWRYTFHPAASCFVFPHRRVWEYPWFVALSLARFIGVEFKGGTIRSLFTFEFGWQEIQSVIATLIGMALLAFFLAIFFRQVYFLLKHARQPSPVTFISVVLLSYTLLFGFQAALGRVCLGLWASQSSRYMTLLIPGFIGIYFSLLQIVDLHKRDTALFFFVVTLLLGSALSVRADYKTAVWHSVNKQRWKQCYLQTENRVQCDQQFAFQIYRWDDSYLQKRMHYLKSHKFNLYLDK